MEFTIYYQAGKLYSIHINNTVYQEQIKTEEEAEDIIWDLIIKYNPSNLPYSKPGNC